MPEWYSGVGCSLRTPDLPSSNPVGAALSKSASLCDAEFYPRVHIKSWGFFFCNKILVTLVYVKFS